MYTYIWMMIYLVERHLKSVLKSTLNKIGYAMSMLKDFSHDFGLWTLIYDLWDKNMRIQSSKAYVFISNVNKGFLIKENLA